MDCGGGRVRLIGVSAAARHLGISPGYLSRAATHGDGADSAAIKKARRMFPALFGGAK
jgi:hypothetical protein